MERSKLAVATAFLSGLSSFVVLTVPLFIRFGWIRPMAGFIFWGLSSLLALIAFGVGLFALRATGAASKPGRGFAIFGVAIGAILGGAFLFNLAAAREYPAINDISTDLADPPGFASDPAELDRDMAYPADFVSIVSDAYPDLVPIHTTHEPLRALELAVQTAEGLGWKVIETDRSAGTLLARQTTNVFRFVDDIVVRVRPAEGGAIVDLRSKSRDGKGDIGANAIRIRAFSGAYPR